MARDGRVQVLTGKHCSVKSGVTAPGPSIDNVPSSAESTNSCAFVSQKSPAENTYRNPDSSFEKERQGLGVLSPLLSVMHKAMN